MLDRILFLLIVVTALPSFSKPSLHADIIVGEDNLVPVNADASNIPSEFQKKIESIGWTNYGCTVTHIGKGYVLSAGHCFEAGPELVTNKGCSYVRFQWGYRERVKNPLKSKCEKIVAMQKNEMIDFAILKVDQAPEPAFLFNYQKKVGDGTPITVFSHPDGRPLHWSQYCSINTVANPLVPPDYYVHDCDTNPGSSGAAMIEISSNTIVGLHKGGATSTNFGSSLAQEPLKGLLVQLGL